MTSSICAENAFENLAFVHDTLSKCIIDRNFLKLLKNIYKKTTIDMILKGGRVNALLLGSGTRQGRTLSMRLINITLTFLPVQQERERGGTSYRLERKPENCLYLLLT